MPSLRLLVSQNRQRRNPNDRPIDDISELIGPQDDIKGLVPWHIGQRHVDGAVELGIDHDIETADLGEGP